MFQLIKNFNETIIRKFVFLTFFRLLILKIRILFALLRIEIYILLKISLSNRFLKRRRLFILLKIRLSNRFLKRRRLFILIKSKKFLVFQ